MAGHDVALLAEGVDRNHFAPDARPPKRVALLAEGVDRNALGTLVRNEQLKSPSSRRAWIEIRAANGTSVSKKVALLAEGVDRNIDCARRLKNLPGRPPRGGRG